MPTLPNAPYLGSGRVSLLETSPQHASQSRGDGTIPTFPARRGAPNFGRRWPVSCNDIPRA